MQIYGPFRVSTTQATNPSDPASRAASPTPSQSKPSAAPVDQLDLSATNRLDGSSSVAGGGEIRVDKVSQLRREIADGSYETPEKIDAALDRLLDQLA